MNETRINFPSNLDYDGKIIREGPQELTIRTQSKIFCEFKIWRTIFLFHFQMALPGFVITLQKKTTLWCLMSSKYSTVPLYHGQLLEKKRHAIAHPQGSYMFHLPLVPHICVRESGQHWFRRWLVGCSAPSHYPNQCGFIVNWTLKNQLQWNFNQNTKIFIHENASVNFVCEKTAVLSRVRLVKFSVLYSISCYDFTVS